MCHFSYFLCCILKPSESKCYPERRGIVGGGVCCWLYKCPVWIIIITEALHKPGMPVYKRPATPPINIKPLTPLPLLKSRTGSGYRGLDTRSPAEDSVLIHPCLQVYYRPKPQPEPEPREQRGEEAVRARAL